MSGEEDEKELELKDLIVQTLEANGLLAKIKAQLRASVFMALDENDKDLTKNNDFQNLKVKKLLQTQEGRLAASLIREFLECCHLDYTISVMDPELNSNIFWDKREKLYKTLNLNETNQESPVLIEYLKVQQQSTPSKELPIEIIDIIRSKFDKFDTTKKNILDKEKIKNLFINLFPKFSKNMIERYVSDEIESSDFKNGARFEDILSLYNKLYSQCLNVSNHTNLKGANQNDNEDQNKFGFITNRNGSKNGMAKQIHNNKNNSTDEDNDDEDEEDDSISTSSAAFKRNDKFQKDNKQNKPHELTKQKTVIENNDDFGFDTLKPNQFKQNDDFFSYGSKKNTEIGRAHV